MAILRITLDNWHDLAEPADSDGVVGSPLTGRATLTPSLDGGGVLTSGAYHSRLTERVKISELPWSYDLVDPTHAMPTGWGWTVTLTPEGPSSRQSFAVLSPETIEATPQVDGVRTIRLEDHLGLSDALGTGGLVRPLPGEPGKPGRGIESIAPDGLVTYTDGGTDSLTLPEGTPGRSVVSITAETGSSEATILYSDGETGTLTLPQGEKGDPGEKGEQGEKGEPGETGPAPEPSSVTASAVTLPPGSAASAEVVGDWPVLDYRLGIPRGEQGDPGPIGRQGPPGVVATPGDYQIVGPGRPDVPATTSGAVTGSEPTGCLYVSTDGAGVGAWTWRKRPTGWTVEVGNTGWREVLAAMRIVDPELSAKGGFPRPQVCRINDMIHLNIGVKVTTPNADWADALGQRTTGWRTAMPNNWQIPPAVTGSAGVLHWASTAYIKPWVAGDYVLVVSWPARDAWPATLIGSPA